MTFPLPHTFSSDNRIAIVRLGWNRDAKPTRPILDNFPIMLERVEGFKILLTSLSERLISSCLSSWLFSDRCLTIPARHAIEQIANPAIPPFALIVKKHNRVCTMLSRKFVLLSLHDCCSAACSCLSLFLWEVCSCAQCMATALLEPLSFSPSLSEICCCSQCMTAAA